MLRTRGIPRSMSRPRLANSKKQPGPRTGPGCDEIRSTDLVGLAGLVGAGRGLVGAAAFFRLGTGLALAAGSLARTGGLRGRRRALILDAVGSATSDEAERGESGENSHTSGGTSRHAMLLKMGSLEIEAEPLNARRHDRVQPGRSGRFHNRVAPDAGPPPLRRPETQKSSTITRPTWVPRPEGPRPCEPWQRTPSAYRPCADASRVFHRSRDLPRHPQTG